MQHQMQNPEHFPLALPQVLLGVIAIGLSADGWPRLVFPILCFLFGLCGTAFINLTKSLLSIVGAPLVFSFFIQGTPNIRGQQFYRVESRTNVRIVFSTAGPATRDAHVFLYRAHIMYEASNFTAPRAGLM